ncbi:hypothetical protein AVEN_87508-1 [Araneus ventricosus]|uniref:Uncharacterized protein n=1 Tax=Araneus ventricosus TaxID=182803 RepID=A0A4Y2J2U9_ARAVE|nr:hypothetical protein AVEN_87508-1 [Araneus ventricosus]
MQWRKPAGVVSPKLSLTSLTHVEEKTKAKEQQNETSVPNAVEKLKMVSPTSCIRSNTYGEKYTVKRQHNATRVPKQWRTSGSGFPKTFSILTMWRKRNNELSNKTTAIVPLMGGETRGAP